MQTSPPPQPVIRNYRGQTRRAAEEAYRIDAEQAAGASWFPVAHRWADQWDGHTLSVVFEYRPADGPSPGPESGPTTQDAGAVATEAPQAAGAPIAAEPEPPAEAELEPAAAVEAEPELAAAVEAPAAPAIEPTPSAEPAPVTAAPPIGAPTTTTGAHVRLIMETIDLHCAGEPLRLIRTGFPQVPLAHILERRRWVRENADAARRVAMYEPRGHRDMYGAILLPPHRPDADVAVLWMHNEGYSTMCGHGTIAVTTAVIEERLFPATLPETAIRLEVPAGLVTARAQVRTGDGGAPEVERVRFTNVPSYLAARDIALRPDGLELAGNAAQDGWLRVDLAFGGAYYGIVDAADLGLRVVPAEIARLTRAGATITELLRRDHTPTHPTDPDLGLVYGTIIVDADPSTATDGKALEADLRNLTVFADGEVDRSPCGSGTSALLAQRHARGLMAIGDELVNAGITGEAFHARIDGPATLGSQEAIETSVEGRAFVTGYHTFVVDDRDPLGDGFLLR